MNAQIKPVVSARTLGELAQAVQGTVQGDPQKTITGVNGLKEAGPGELSFFNNGRFRKALEETRAGAVLVQAESLPLLQGRDAVVVGDPYLAFARISAIFHPRPRFTPGIDPRAIVEEGAFVDPSATVMAHAFVSAGAQIGPRTVLFPGVFIGAESVLAEDVLVYPNVVVRERCHIGARVIVQPGAVVGADGFGFAFDLERHEHFKIPQAGTVGIGDDVELGANSAVDRATLGVTRIGKGTKIDNLVQVGHNVEIGPLCILCGQVGVAGSTVLGTGVVLGGQVGVVDHLRIADGVRVGARSGVLGDVEKAGTYSGNPVGPHRDWLKAKVAFWKGVESQREVARLRKQVDAMQKRLEELAGGGSN